MDVNAHQERVRHDSSLLNGGVKYPSGRGAHAFVEFAPKEQGNKEKERCPPWASPQEARDSKSSQVGGGLAPPTPNILYEEGEE